MTARSLPPVSRGTDRIQSRWLTEQMGHKTDGIYNADDVQNRWDTEQMA